MLPGRFVLGVRPRRGFSVGGRGAGPGFMNCWFEYMLFCVAILAMPMSYVFCGLEVWAK